MRPAPALLVALHLAVALFGVAGLFGAWLALSPVAIVLGRTLVAALALAVVAAITHGEWTSRTAVSRSTASCSRCTGWRSSRRSRRPASRSGCSATRAFRCGRSLLERVTGERRAGRRDAAVALLVVAGLVLSCLGSTSTTRVIGTRVGHRVRGDVRVARGSQPRLRAQSQPARSIALWQNAFAALCLVPLVLALPDGNAIPRRATSR